MGRRGLKLFFDGGCRPNPGRMEAAVVARGVHYLLPDLGDGTSNDAEWLALLHALCVADALGETDIECVGDSLLVVAQATGAWKCRDAGLRRHLAAFTAAKANFASVRVRHVRRAKNLAGIVLDARRQLPPEARG